MDKITVTLTKDQARQIIRILDYGKADPLQNGSYEPEDKKFNAFLTRIQTKLERELVK